MENHTYLQPPATHHKAPWTCPLAWNNFFVNQRGEVRVCCNNNTLVGNLNTTDFNEIWSSGTLPHLRSLLLGGDFVNASCSSACHELAPRFPENYAKYGNHCIDYDANARTGDAWLDSLPQSPFLKPTCVKENDIINIKEFDLEVCATKSMPTKGLIVPIGKCNLYCPFCNTGVSGEEGTTPNEVISEQALERLRAVYPYLKYLEIVGAGEIFFYPPKNSPMTKIFNDMAECANPDLELMPLTNGIALKKPWVDEIIRTNIVTTLAISIDTVDPGNYRIMRKGGNIDTLKQNIGYMEEMKAKHGRTKPRWRFNIILNSLTVKHLKHTYDYIKQMDTAYIFMLPMVSGGHSWVMEKYDMFRPEKKEELLELRSILDYIEIPSNKSSIYQRIDQSLCQ